MSWTKRVVNAWRRNRPRLYLWLDLGFVQVGTTCMYSSYETATFQYGRLYVMAFGHRLCEFTLWTDEVWR